MSNQDDNKKGSSIPVLNIMDQMRAFYRQFAQEFTALFHLQDNGALRCRNEDIPRFQEFIGKWHSFVSIETSTELGAIALQQAGQGDMATILQNKMHIFRLYGACLSCYLKACRALGQQPSALLCNGMLVEWEGFSGVQSPVGGAPAGATKHERKPSH